MAEISSETVSLARDGNAAALEEIIRAMQDRVHRLALRMLADPEHAKDATQEILIRIVTRLAAFRGESKFETWAYRVATNYLLTAQSVLSRLPPLTFDIFEDDLNSGLVDDAQAAPEDHVMLNDLRIRCTMAMLVCLKAPARVAYVLGDILEMDHAEAAEILEIEKATYRQRLARARKEVEAFTARSCGLVSADAPCRCPRRLPAAIELGRVGPDSEFGAAPNYDEVKADAAKVQSELATLKLQRATGPLPAPKDLVTQIMQIVVPSG